MAYKMSEILPNLYLGNIVNSMDSRHLKESNITHIVSVYEKARRRYPELNYLLIKVHDRENENLREHFSEANDFIHTARLQSSKVLVHCIKGASRSATIVTAYVMSVTNLGWVAALQAVKAGRAAVEPNKGFLRQLAEFEANGCDEERMRLGAAENARELRALDIERCDMKLKMWRGEVVESEAEENVAMINEGEKLESNAGGENDRSEDVGKRDFG